MKYFFKLQKSRIERFIVDFGLRPWSALLIGIIVLALVSLLLFMRTDLAGYIVGFFGLSLCFSLGEKHRNSFLQQTFDKFEYRKIRLLENLIVIAPFVVAILFMGRFMEAGISLIISLLLSLVQFRGFQGKAI